MNRFLNSLIGLTVLAASQSAYSDAEQGHDLFSQWCAHCHGEGQVATVYLAQRYKDAVPAMVEARKDLTEEYVRMRIRTQIPGMPAFRPTELSDDDVQSLAAYLTRNNP